MVADNPLFTRWTAKKFSATVLDDIWPEVIFFTLVATVVSIVSLKTNVDLGVSNQLLTVLGLVLGLVISFRTSSAYERYQDGRKMWTNIIVASKNTAQMIWVHVPLERQFPPGSNEKPMTPLQVTIEKKTMVNLIQAYAVSVKHLLRGEQGVYYRDLYPLLAFLPRYANQPAGSLAPPKHETEKLPLWHLRDGHDFLLDDGPETEAKAHVQETTALEKTQDRRATSGSGTSGGSTKTPNGTQSRKEAITIDVRQVGNYDPESVLPEVESEFILKPARNPPHTSVFDYFPLLRLFRWIGRGFVRRSEEERIQRKKRKAYSEIVESHIPLEILLALSSYSALLIIFWGVVLMKYEFVKPAIASGLTSNILLMMDTVSNLERICNTPLPFAYQAHLRMSLWIYLLLLPFQIYSSYAIITIPATAFASFLLLGFLEIGQEIENPFNYDLNDLDLDYFCQSLQRDLAEITANANHDPAEYIFNALNKPLAPADHRDAEELTKMEVYSHQDDDGTVQPGSPSLRKTLVAGWRTVEELTRKKV